MLSRHAITSGNNCTNIQIDNIESLKWLSAEELDGIRNDITQAILNNAQKEYKITNLLGVDEAQSQLLSAFHTEKLIDTKELILLLEGWSPTMPYANRIDALDKILSACVYTIANNNQLALFITEHITSHQLIRKLVMPSCKISLELNININDLDDLVQTIKTLYLTQDNKLTVKHQIYIIKVIFAILYKIRTDEDDINLEKILNDTLFVSHSLTEQFFVDAYFRICLNYLSVSPALGKFFKKHADLYFQNYPQNPLAYLKRTILNPLEIYDEFSIETVVEDLSKVAFLCQNTIEARWVLSALLKLLPLYKTEDLDLDYDKSIELVVNKFSADILANFHFLRYAHLRSVLYIFCKTGNPAYLVKYENEFLVNRDSLVWHEQVSLQIEYASSLYVFLLNNNTEFLENTRFFELLNKNTVNLVEHKLFANIYVIDDDSIVNPENSLNKGKILKFLYSYINRIYLLYVERQLEKNAFLLFKYRSTLKIPLLRSRFHLVVTNFIRREPSDAISNNYSYANKILSLIEFSKTSKFFGWPDLAEWSTAALKGNRYDIVLNGRSLAYVLYSMKYYYDKESAVLCDEIAVKFKLLTIFQDKQPRLYWATAACLSLIDNRIESEFVYLLYKSLEQANVQFYKLSLRNDEQFNIVIPEKAIQVVNSSKLKGSLLALAGSEYLLTPEYWNLLATTVFNLSFPDKLESLDIASIFYSMAKCFAREQRSIDQKYFYNYIRSRSLYYLISESEPPDGFIRDCSFYLDRPNNQYFYFKNKCCMPLFELLKIYYVNTPIDIKQLYEQQILPKRNWVKKAFLNLEIGVFKEKIKIQ